MSDLCGYLDVIPFWFVGGIIGGMPKILYSQVITEDPHELKKLEKHHRYTHLFQRVRMLRLLKSGECSNLGEAPPSACSARSVEQARRLGRHITP